MPARIETVEFVSNGTVSRKLLYAGGMLFETANDRTTRFAEIDQADKAWLEETIAIVSKQLSPTGRMSTESGVCQPTASLRFAELTS